MALHLARPAPLDLPLQDPPLRLAGTRCPHCRGRGVVRLPAGDLRWALACPVCGGRGRLREDVYLPGVLNGEPR
jgi:DNA-directed RNA polymerase subunit RPC12/RpoP